MPRRLIIGLTVLTAAAALTGAPASAQSPPTLARFTVPTGILPYLEQDNFTSAEGRSMSFELFALRADPDVVLSWRADGPRSGTIVFVDAAGRALGTYYLESAWPSEVSISGLRAGASEVLMETLKITASGVRRLS